MRFLCVKKFPFLFLATLFLGVFAVDYGRYLCRSCVHPMHPSDVSVFVRTVVNRNVGMWRAGDTFCDGRVCTRYRTPHPNATVWSVDFSFPDVGAGYQGEGSSIFMYIPDGYDPYAFAEDILDGWYHVTYDPVGRVTIHPLEPVCDDEAIRTGRYQEIGACA